MVNMNDINISVIGGSGVGKSSIVVSFISGVFLGSYKHLDVSNIYTKVMKYDELDYTVNVMDSHTGDPLFQKEFIVNSDALLLVYSIDSYDSFKLAKFLFHDFMSMRDYKEVHTIILGNKSDLEHIRQVPIEEGRKLAKELNGIFIEGSAMDHSDVVKIFEVFLELSKNAPEPYNKNEECNNNDQSFCNMI